MIAQSEHLPAAAGPARAAPVPVIALDVASAGEALRLADLLPDAGWVKVGLELFTAAGPGIVRDLRARDRRVFLDLKLLDIPNTVARAVRAAAALGAELLTVHASGGRSMLRAGVVAAGETSGIRLLAVTALTSFSPEALAEAWGRERVEMQSEAARLAALAADCGADGVVAAVHEVAAIRERAGNGLQLVCPGIRLPGDAAGDQARVATPADAARAGADYIVLGRSVTAAASPAAAWERVIGQMAAASAGEAQ